MNRFSQQRPRFGENPGSFPFLPLRLDGPSGHLHQGAFSHREMYSRDPPSPVVVSDRPSANRGGMAKNRSLKKGHGPSRSSTQVLRPATGGGTRTRRVMGRAARGRLTERSRWKRRLQYHLQQKPIRRRSPLPPPGHPYWPRRGKTPTDPPNDIFGISTPSTGPRDVGLPKLILFHRLVTGLSLRLLLKRPMPIVGPLPRAPRIWPDLLSHASTILRRLSISKKIKLRLGPNSNLGSSFRCWTPGAENPGFCKGPPLRLPAH